MRNIASKLTFLFLLCLCNSVHVFAKALNREGNNIVKADQMFFDQEKNILRAVGNVRILSGKEYLESDEVLIDVVEKKIWINQEFYAENDNQKVIGNSLYIDEKNNLAHAKGAKIKLNESDMLIAKEITRKNEFELEINKGSFSPCNLCVRKHPLWQLNAKKTYLDFKNKQIKYKHATFEVAGFKIAYFPYFSHPMKDAPAKSGILKPELYKNTVRIPIYYIIKPNIDVTYTPRISSKVFIHEVEFRHLLETGRYNIDGSYTKSRLKTKGEKSSNKDKNIDRFYYKVNGDFIGEKFDYGYNLERVSDKSYLKNFYENNASFLKSNFYVSNIHDSGYVYGDVQNYQGLRLKDNQSTDPKVMPNIIIRRDIEFENDLELSLKNKTVNYIETGGVDISRNSLNLNLNKNIYFSGGEVLNFSITNIVDSYYIRKAKGDNFSLRDKTITRNTPEAQTGVRLPFYFSGEKLGVLIEPQTSLVVGLNDPKNINKYKLIDSPNLDFNESNIFENSRYSGVDYREHGTRFTYGVNKALIIDDLQISSFIGQLLKSNSDTSSSKSNYVGKVGISYSDIFDMYYRFQRKSKNFQAFRDEIVANLNINKFSILNEFTSLKKIKNNLYYKEYIENIESNSIDQNYTSASYKFTDHLTGFGDIRIDLSRNNKSKVLSNGFGVNYDFDCISIMAKIVNDYTFDPTRNIKKSKNYTVKLGLKSINM